MPNTVHGPFVPIVVVNGSTAANATWGTNAQTQADAALHGFNGDLLTPFVLSGCVATRNGGNLKQLDVTSGSVYIKMTDGTIGLIATIASVTNQFLTSTPSTTYFLDINPDGTWSFATSHSGVTNHLTICSLTTDGSGNINVITDARTLNTTLLASALGALSLPTTFTSTNGAGSGFAWTPALSGTPFLFPLDINPTNGSNPTHWAIGYNGADGHLQIQQVTGNIDVIDIDTSGNVFFAKQISGVGNQATVGSFGVPVIAGLVKGQSITSTTQTTLITVTSPTGTTTMCRATMQIWIGAGNTNNGTVSAIMTYSDPVFAGTTTLSFVTVGSNLTLNPNTLTKGLDARTVASTFEVKSGTTITIKYQNSAAGTIADRVSAFLEFIG